MDDDTRTDQNPEDDGGKTAHTPPDQPHPDLEKEDRTDRDVGGPSVDLETAETQISGEGTDLANAD